MTAMQRIKRCGSRGSSTLEAMIAVTAIVLVGMSAVQWARIHEARGVADHAALRAARAGAVENAEVGAIRDAFARGLLPLYSPEESLSGSGGVAETLTTEVKPAVTQHSRLRILNPTREAFEDFGVTVDGERQIPFRDLSERSTDPGSASGINIQDANLLRVEMTYGHKHNVPFVGWTIARAAEAAQAVDPSFDSREMAMLANNRLPITVTKTVRMQSRAERNGKMASIDAIDNGPWVSRLAGLRAFSLSGDPRTRRLQRGR